MEVWRTFDALLGSEMEPQSWSEHYIDQASDMMSRFEDDDWGELQNEWPERSAAWQERCVQVLSESSSDSTIDVVLDVLARSDDPNVQFAAADSLRVMLQGAPMSVPREVRRKVSQLAEGMTGLRRASLDDLLKLLVC